MLVLSFHFYLSKLSFNRNDGVLLLLLLLLIFVTEPPLTRCSVYRYANLFLIFSEKDSFILHSACIYACTPEEGTRSHRWLWATMWLLGLELRMSGRAASAVNLWAISPAQERILNPLKRHCLHSGCHRILMTDNSSFTGCWLGLCAALEALHDSWMAGAWCGLLHSECIPSRTWEHR